ncbi:sulfite exporter TauE/SafE family protein [Vibrio sinaloensis]|uniref:sulfite exporter TauE/SafE family protein n=1 Tax=Photobacterium sp. (strain ATCC 43367) TaxID=379097 RepID=UPI0022AEC0F2|nr:sulfite exporter TauE/SafE family protein [Vibrio sinaloensis]MCZ4292613.1 sulfite exporter TauE/SafE family protein [Vibrio sinaloensis]
MEWILLFGAGVLGGILNSIAGGGSFITFPALMFVGVPPVIANATNTFAACAGYISGTYGFRQDIAQSASALKSMIFFSLLGGAIGAYLLLSVSEQQFLVAIPWLLLFATLLFVFGNKISHWVSLAARTASLSPIWAVISITLLLILVSAYGGFFNAGLGVIVLSYLVLAGHNDINQMNGLKLLISSCVSIIAIVVFVLDGAIDWPRGFAVMLGTLSGGYVAARVSRKVEQVYVKGFVALSSIAMTVYFFVDVYW